MSDESQKRYADGDAHSNRKPFAITLDTVYMDSYGSSIYITIIIVPGICKRADSISKCEFPGFMGFL